MNVKGSKGNYNKWVAVWGNAPSVTDRAEGTYAKDLTLRYPILMPLEGGALRLHLSNACGTEEVRIDKVTIAVSTGDRSIDVSTLKVVTFGDREEAILAPGREIVSDEIAFDVVRGTKLSVSMYMAGYTSMMAGVKTKGPLSKYYFGYGDYAEAESLPLNYSRESEFCYFLTTVDVLTRRDCHAYVCYGDSITAQSWPEYLALKILEDGPDNVAVVRKAISGTRVLREYNCVRYVAYGPKAERRIVREILNTAGASHVIFFQGINDIIHPEGGSNVFRPMSDLPSLLELQKGVRDIVLEPVKAAGLKIIGATLLPIGSWRTFADFREELRTGYNDWIRNSGEFDGCADFDALLRDPEDEINYLPQYDAGDHLHCSELGYKTMAEYVYEKIM